MAQEIRQYSASIPAGTQPTAPATFHFRMPWRIARQVEIVVPPGGSGMVGFNLGFGGVPIIPYGSDLFIVTADEKMVWPLDRYPDSGDWTLTGYNTGTLDHSIYVRFLLDVPQLGADVTQVAVIDATDIENAGSFV